MLVGIHVPTADVHVQFNRDVAIVLDGEDVVVGIDHTYTGRQLQHASREGTGRLERHAQHGLLEVIVEHQHERLQVADDLMHILHDTRNGLVLVHHAIDPEAPDGRTTKRRQQHATHRVAEGVPETALERLQAEFCDERVVVALRRFDELRAHKTAEIDCCHRVAECE